MNVEIALLLIFILCFSAGIVFAIAYFIKEPKMVYLWKMAMVRVVLL